MTYNVFGGTLNLCSICLSTQEFESCAVRLFTRNMPRMRRHWKPCIRVWTLSLVSCAHQMRICHHVLVFVSSL